MTQGELAHLFRYVESGDVESLRQQLTASDGEETSKHLSAKRGDGITLLHAAAFHGTLPCLQELVERWGGESEAPKAPSSCSCRLSSGWRNILPFSSCVDPHVVPT